MILYPTLDHACFNPTGNIVFFHCSHSARQLPEGTVPTIRQFERSLEQLGLSLA